jgi:predicted MPP superfamily phosphohydrolase
LIVLDHRPAPLAELEREGVDLQISGHTHAGQIWPVTWLVRLLNEVAVGHGQRGAARLYVTSGLGLWGLPVRIGSVSELLDLRVEFAPPDGSAGKPCAEGWRFSGN